MKRKTATTIKKCKENIYQTYTILDKEITFLGIYIHLKNT